MKNTATIISLALFLGLAGCAAVGPDYQAPVMETPAQWTEQARPAPLSPEEEASLVRWWEKLGDPVLSRLIETAMENNLDARIAIERVREARARAGMARADLYPAVTAEAAENTRRSSENAGGGTENKSWSAGFDASWELDIFGGSRRAAEAAAAAAEGAEFSRADVLVSLAAETARNYVGLRVYQARLAVAKKNLAIQEQTRDIAAWREKAGLATALDVERASYQAQSTAATLPQLTEQARQAENRITLLLGQAPGSLSELLEETKTLPLPPEQVAEGIPAQLLSRRPDIRRAERELAAQNARIGVATAGLYPRFFLSGNIGLSALSAGDLFQWKSRTYGFGPSASWNVFDAGSTRDNIAVQEALAEQARLSYEKAVLTALSDVEDALVSFSRQQERLVHLYSAEQSAAEADRLAAGEYEAGLSDITAVLDAEKARFSLEESRVVCQGNIVDALVSLYKALGGGWEPQAAAEAEGR